MVHEYDGWRQVRQDRTSFDTGAIFSIAATGAVTESATSAPEGSAATSFPIVVSPGAEVQSSVRSKEPGPTAGAAAGLSEMDSEDSINIVLNQENGQPAGIIQKGRQYKLVITSSDIFFIGAVQLQASQTKPRDFVNRVDCLQGEQPQPPETQCLFRPRDFFGPITRRQVTGTENQFKVSIPLTMPEEIQEGTVNYRIQVAWSRKERPLLQEVTWSDLLDPRSESPVAMVWVVQPPSVSDPGIVLPTQTFLTGATTTNNKNTATANLSSVSSTATASPDNDQQKGSGGTGGLSAGAKAGISVGAVLGVLAILALIFLCLRRRKSKRVTAGGYYGDAPGSSNDLREKEAGVGIAAIPLSASQSPASERNSHAAGDSASLGRGHSARVVDGATMERGDGVGRHATTGHTAPAAAAVAAAPVSRKPVHRNVSDEEPATGRYGAISSQSQVLSDEERARWEEEERRLDEDIAEAERRRLA